MKFRQVTFAFVLAVLPLIIFGQNSLSPYFYVQSEAGPGSFPLVSNDAKAIINGPVADVRITQTYRNDGSMPIEAMYVFPASTRAAVYHMEMRIGDRVITAEIMEKHEATVTYEAAKAEGKRAGLLEQSRPNVFQMHVANILPGEEIQVNMKYTEFIIPEDQVYTFVYPTVVGPRYTGKPGEQPPAAFASMPYTVQGQLPHYQFDLEVDLRMPVPVESVECTTHSTLVRNYSATDIGIQLDPQETQGGDRDYILKYRLAGDEIVSGVMTYSDGKDNYFLCQVEPPMLTRSTTIVPREYIFILDVSGSMSGFPLDVSKGLMRKLLTNMRPTDKFNMLCFAGSAFMLHPQSVTATPSNIQQAFQSLSQLHGSGGTELLPALRRALQAPKASGYSRSFVIATDGYVTVEEEAFQLVHDELNKANFFAFGIGSSVNRHLIEGLAHVGRGEPFIVKDNNEAHDIADKLRIYIEHPVLTNIQISCSDVDLYGLIPTNIPDLMASRPIYCFGKYEAGVNPTIHITGNQGGQTFSRSMVLPEPSRHNTALPYLWAREQIRFLSDFNVVNTSQERIAEITRLGLEYNLLTRYTSFVAVDDEPVVEANTTTQKVRQPVPLPQGVSNMAVGFELELDIVDFGDSSTILDVEVSCDQKDIRMILELVIEEVLQALSPETVLQLAGMSLKLELYDNAMLRVVASNTVLPDGLIPGMQKALDTLGLSLSQIHSATITISGITHPK